jgi:hypothetical protein
MTFDFTSLKEHLVTALATTAMLGASTALVSHEVELGRQDERIARIEKLDDSMDELSKEMVETRLVVAKMQGEQGASK